MKLLELQFFLFEQNMYDELSKPFYRGLITVLENGRVA